MPPSAEPTGSPDPTDSADADTLSLSGLALRGGVGGVLMGLANLVPGISGGTMLLATGIYPAFIGAIADVTRLRLRQRSLLLLAAVGGAAALAILTLAGPTKTLVVEQRWVMYSVFIGLTLGGVPLVWRLARPAVPSLWLGAALGLAVMLLMVAAPGAGSAGSGPDYLRLTLSGMAGAGAMILPGVSGGYLLLLLGQYVPILGAVDDLKQGLLALASGEGGSALLLESFHVVVPVGVGVVLGVVGISQLLRYALRRFPKATLGFLLGLLVGALLGLWPFQEGVKPEVGQSIDGRVLGAEEIAELEPEDWPVEFFRPAAGQALGAAGLIIAGFLATSAIDRLGRRAGRGDSGGSEGSQSSPA